MRVLLFAGKGGAGTTTVAAATALAAARRGVKTLLLSADQPDAVENLLGARLTPGSPREVEPSLAVLHCDPEVQLARTWATARRSLHELIDAHGVGSAEVASLLTAIGAPAILPVLTLREQACGGPWDLVVVDSGTGPQAVRMLTAADDLLRLVDVVWSPERRLGLRWRRPHPLVSHAVVRLRGELDDARCVLRSPTTSVRLVLAPERSALAHARRTATAVVAQGLAVDGVVVNRVMAHGAAWPASARSAQQEVLSAADASFVAFGLLRVPHLEGEIGPDEISRLADPQQGAIGSLMAADQVLAAPRPPQPCVRRVGAAFELVLPLPFAAAAEVALTRDGDELHLAVAGTRRVVQLPSVLRRCSVRSASLDDGELVVRLDKDPSLWPRRADDDPADDDPADDDPADGARADGEPAPQLRETAR